MGTFPPAALEGGDDGPEPVGEHVLLRIPDVALRAEEGSPFGRFFADDEAIPQGSGSGFLIEYEDDPFLVTNYHVPGSSLVVLVAAFMGERWREAYRTALERGYRFLSFGDAMLLERAT